MTRNDVEKIIMHMDKYARTVDMETLMTGLFIWWRLGSLENINDVQLGKIKATVCKEDSVFSETLRDEIEEIVYEV